MTAPPPIEIVGVDQVGAVVVRVLLAQGADPVEVLASRGFAATAVRSADRGPAPQHLLTLAFAVVPLDAADRGREPAPSPPSDEDLVVRAGEVARVVQRVAAYAVVTSAQGVLLTEFSELTNAPGQWGLPGGGLDPEESPRDAVVREIWEETGQRVGEPVLERVDSSHWVGRSPRGVLEDFHAVRVVYTATCETPVPPHVHDVGGTTSAARWVPEDELAELPLTSVWRALLVELLRSDVSGCV